MLLNVVNISLKARWNQFTDFVESEIRCLPSPSKSNLNTAYSAFCLLFNKAAKRSIPRGCRQNHIPAWGKGCDSLYARFTQSDCGSAEDENRAPELIQCLDKKRKERWERAVQDIDFTHSSRRAWKIFHPLSGRCTRPKRFPITANNVANQLLENGRFHGADKNHAREVKQQSIMLWNAAGVDGHLCKPFTVSELKTALKQLKIGKAHGPDNIPSEFVKHCGPKSLEWLCSFYSTCTDSLAIPKIWRKATVVAILKPHKLENDAKSYRPISLLCIPYKLMKRLLLARLEPVIDSQLPQEQAGFRRNRSTVQQVVN